MFKVAILGCENSHANKFLNAIYKDKIVDDVEIVGVYGYDPVNTDAAQKLHDEYGVYAAESYDEFVGKVDGVIITARHGDYHYKYAKPYIESGIPMFIDKPITCTEEDAKAFMAELKAHNVPVCGGSVTALTPHIQELKKVVAEKSHGKVWGGHVRGPMDIENVYGGFYFYTQHIAQATTTIFGNYPNSVMTFPREDTYNCVMRYDDYDVTMAYIVNNYNYYAAVSCEDDFVGGMYQITEKEFQREFLDFHDLLLGKPQKQSYEDFFAPVFVLNAVYRSLKSGKEEPVHRIND